MVGVRPVPADWPTTAANLLVARPELDGIGLTGALEAVVTA